MEYRKFSRVRWLVRVGNVGLITGLVLLIVYNCHPMPAWLIVLLVVTGVLIVWGGRMFCGYACPVGLTLDALWALSKKLKVRSIRRSDRFNRFVKGFKYFFLVFYTVLHFVLGIDPGWFLVFLLVVTAPFLVRFWCSFCPVGTVLGLMNQFSPMAIRKDAGRCAYCSQCSKACPMQSKRVGAQRRSGRTRSAECILCGECVGRCRREGALRLTYMGKTVVASKASRTSSPKEQVGGKITK